MIVHIAHNLSLREVKLNTVSTNAQLIHFCNIYFLEYLHCMWHCVRKYNIKRPNVLHAERGHNRNQRSGKSRFFCLKYTLWHSYSILLW